MLTGLWCDMGSCPLVGAHLSLYAVPLPLADDGSHGSDLDLVDAFGAYSGLSLVCGECGSSAALVVDSMWTMLNLPPGETSC